MRQRSPLAYTALILAFFATTAAAQIYQWKDASGKTIISDKPPPGHTQQQRKIETNTAAPAGASARKSLAEQDLEFRKRQKDAQDRAAKEEKEQKAETEKKEQCANMRRNLQTLESGVRIARYDDSGERSFLGDEQRQEEIAKTRQSMEANCN